MINYIINVKAKNSGYKIEVLEIQGKILVPVNKRIYKSLKGLNIIRYYDQSISLQSFNFVNDIQSLIEKVHNRLYANEEYNFMINYTDI